MPSRLELFWQGSPLVNVGINVRRQSGHSLAVVRFVEPVGKCFSEGGYYLEWGHGLGSVLMVSTVRIELARTIVCGQYAARGRCLASHSIGQRSMAYCCKRPPIAKLGLPDENRRLFVQSIAGCHIDNFKVGHLLH
jgi:hypothetical protein